MLGGWNIGEVCLPPVSPLSLPCLPLWRGLFPPYLAPVSLLSPPWRGLSLSCLLLSPNWRGLSSPFLSPVSPMSRAEPHGRSEPHLPGGQPCVGVVLHRLSPLNTFGLSDTNSVDWGALCSGVRRQEGNPPPPL